MKLRGRRTGRAAAAAALSLLVLSGCGIMTPGTAAEVNDTRITDQQVSDLADAQCTAADRAAKSGQSTPQPISRVRQQSLGLLIDSELSKQFGEAEDVQLQQSVADGFFKQLEPGIDPLPEQARSELTDVFTDWARGRAILVQAGSEATGTEVSFTNTDQLIQAGLQRRDAWMKDNAKIETDPRYSPNEQGFPGGGDGSVSRPDSDFAKASGSAQPNPDWVSGLPQSQKCG